ncbi:unnamed protein product [Symbiodinium sp. KB8]|nr:unnamed protein product [Symbiodinium sp. KB8]
MLNIGSEDTLAFYTVEEFAAGFKLKQNSGSSEGIWIIKLKACNYCTSPGVAAFRGAKDTLWVAMFNKEMLSHNTAKEFAVGFEKTQAFQPRVTKRNRGLSGESTWIIELMGYAQTLRCHHTYKEAREANEQKAQDPKLFFRFQKDEVGKTKADIVKENRLL